MLNLNKYKLNYFLITENVIDLNKEVKYSNNYNFKKNNNIIFINYLFKKKIKIVRSLIHTYSIFLCFYHFNYFIYKSNIQFKIRINNSNFLIMENEYNDFFI